MPRCRRCGGDVESECGCDALPPDHRAGYSTKRDAEGNYVAEKPPLEPEETLKDLDDDSGSAEPVAYDPRDFE